MSIEQGHKSDGIAETGTTGPEGQASAQPTVDLIAELKADNDRQFKDLLAYAEATEPAAAQILTEWEKAIDRMAEEE